ncbi:MAG: PAS domain-containing sensor histidine kinase, partial [bacterium]
GIITDRTGRELAIFFLKSGKDGIKRGVIAVDMRSRAVAWEFLYGPQFANYAIDDINGDGYQEILIGTYSPDNGIVFNGTKDDSSYVFLLNSEGELLWKKALGGIYTGAWVGACGSSDNSRKEIIAYRFSLSDKAPSQDIIVKLDPQNGETLEEKRFGKRFTAFWQISYTEQYSCFKDLDGDGSEEIAIGNTDGYVRVFDRNLHVLHTSNRVKSPTVIAINDFGGDKAQEVVASTSDNKLIFFSQDLKTLKTVELLLTSSKRIVRSENKPYILLMKPNPDPRGSKLLYSLLELKKLPFPLAVVQRERLIWGWLMGIAVLTALLVYYRKLLFGSYGRKALFAIFSNTGQIEEMLILKPNGKIIRMGKEWENLCAVSSHQAEMINFQQIFSTENCRPVRDTLHEMITYPVRERTFDALVNQKTIKIKLICFYVPLLRLYFVHFSDLAEQEHVRQIKSWAPVAQQLAHGIKNPLTTVKLNVEDLRDLLKTRYALKAPEIGDYFDAILSQVNRLTKMSDGFMRFAHLEKPDIEAADVNQLIQELIPQWPAGETKSIKVEYRLADRLPRALVDCEQFSFVLKTVFFNALESIQERGRILISTSFAQLFGRGENGDLTGEFIEIQVRDTGCGIAPEFLAKIWQPFFTLKPEGTGIGLTRAKKIMQDHGGQIEIDSEEGVGTTVTLRLKIAR